MIQVCIKAHFDAAHFIRNYNGNCAKLHGHRWNVVVCIEGKQLDHLGMLIDFREVRQIIQNKIKLLDHTVLNNLPAFGREAVNPTAENIAQFIFTELKQDLDLSEKRIAWVQVNESPDAWAIYKETDE